MQVIPRNCKVAFLAVVGLMCQINAARSQVQNKSELRYLLVTGNKGKLGIEMSGAVLPKATITKNEGNYDLRSHIQSCYDVGILYFHIIDSTSKLISGLHFVVGKWNYFAFIPAADFPSNMNITNELYLEHKYLWNKFRVPLIFEKTIFKKNRRPLMNLSVGVDLSFFPFEVNFEGERHVVLGSNNQAIKVLETVIFRTNNKKPWINFLVGLSKNFTKRKNVVIGIEANFSSTNFMDGTYVFTVPGKPQTSGNYRINGTGYALKAQYIFRHRR